jgi:hypothetical protein
MVILTRPLLVVWGLDLAIISIYIGQDEREGRERRGREREERERWCLTGQKLICIR